jgi:hypothetical protein
MGRVVHRSIGTIGLLGLATIGGGCVTPATTARSVTAGVEAAPELRPGDRWVYEWKSGDDSATKTVEIVEIKEVNKVRYYVVRSSETEQFYAFDFYTLELHWAGRLRDSDSKVEFRMVPPQPWFVWPLEVGRRWTHRGTFEEPGKRTPHNDAFAVMAVETVEVPAGRFEAFKVARDTDRRDSDLYWYAPQVRWYVKWVGQRGGVQFEEQLREYKGATKLIPQ